MENHSQSFDVCIICALPEEVRAFLAVIKPHCDDHLEEHTSPGYGYNYRSAVLKNDNGELLTLHISWLPRYGPQEMTLHLSRVLEECRPRIAIMTGICAGDAQRVQLGDLVVAERAFTYDNGKFITDEQGRRVHLHDTLTYQLDANILQFLGIFDDWMPLVAGLETPQPMLDQRQTVCHIKAMASGSAVRADRPFQEVQAPVHDTVAIDMEGAAFGLVMSRYPLTRWLIVKGVCDFADQEKNDSYHDYAARASASYALRFLQVYVTNERLPRPDELSPSSRVGTSHVWNVPFLRNPHFTGREDLLDQLIQRLSPEDQGDFRHHPSGCTDPDTGDQGAWRHWENSDCCRVRLSLAGSWSLHVYPLDQCSQRRGVNYQFYDTRGTAPSISRQRRARPKQASHRDQTVVGAVRAPLVAHL